MASGPSASADSPTITADAGDAAGRLRGACCYRLRRPESEADWRTYHHIRRDVMLESREHSFQHPSEDEELAPRHFPLLFCMDDRAIGTIRIDHLDGGFAALRLVAIDPARQGQGHGLQLLQTAESFARELGCQVAVVYSTPEAAGFYGRAGYVEDSWDDCCVGGIVQMTKPLT